MSSSTTFVFNPLLSSVVVNTQHTILSTMKIFRKASRERLYSQTVKIFIESSGEESKSNQESRAIRKIIYFGSSLKFLPFSWNFKTDKIEVATDRNRTLVNLNLSWIFSYVGLKLYFLAYKQITGHSLNKVSYSITGSLFFVMFCLALLLHINNLMHLDDIVCTINTYSNRIRRQLGEIFKIERTVCLLELFWSFYFSIIHIILILAIPVFIRNKSNLSLYRYFGGTDWKICFVFLLLDLYCLYSFLVILGFYVYLVVDCAAVVEKLSKHMKIRIHGISSISLSNKRIEELKYLQSCCNEVHIAFVSYKAIMETLVIPLFLAAATILSSLGLFTVIKFFGELGIFLSMVLSIGESFCISMTSISLCKVSSICDNSNYNSEVLQKELCHLQLVPKKNKHELKVIMKCIRPIRFKIGEFFPVSRQTATDFLETLCSWLTTLLLTYG